MNSKRSLSLLIPFLAISFVVVGLWIPFGFKTTGLVEEWGVLSLLNAGHQLFFVTPDSVLSAHALRPFTVLPHAIAYTLDPNSFLWFNMQQIVFFIGKGIFAYLILKRMLPNHQTFAFMVAVLFIVHPSDTGLFTFRAIHIHGSVMFYLIATYFLLAYYENRRWWMLIIMWITLATSLFMYEVAYPIVAFTPVVLMWTARQINRKVIRVSFLWYLVPLITGIYGILVLQKIGSDQLYQTASRGMSPLSELLKALGKVYSRSFVTGWTEVQLQSPYLLPALILSGLVFLVSLYLMQSTATRIPIKRSITLFIIGLGVIFLGFFFYLIYSTHLFQTIRTYYISSLGAALSIGILAYLIAGRKKIIFVGVMSVLIALSFVNGFNQHRYYQEMSMKQQRFLGQMVEQLPVVEGEQTIFIRENTNLLDTEWFFQWNPALSSTLQYVYKNPNLNAIICYMAVGKTYSTPLEFIPCPSSEGMIVFDYSFEDELQLISRLNNDTAFLPTLFSCWPIEDCTTPLLDLILTAPTLIDSDHIVGSGWRVSEQLDAESYRWSILKESKVLVNIPEGTRYKIEFRVVNSGSDQDGPDLFINEHSIELVRSNDGLYKGIIPINTIERPIDDLRFVIDRMTDYETTQLGFAIGWIKIDVLTPLDNLQIEFDNLLSGNGWRGAEIYNEATFQWSVSETAEVDLDYLAQRIYQVTVKPLMILDPNSFDEVELWVGETQLDAVFSPETKYISAVLPKGLVKEDGITTLLIKVPQLVEVDSSKLGVAIDWVKVEPVIFLDNIQIDFDAVLPDTGWRMSETTADGTTFQWSVDEDANINLGLLKQQDYTISIQPIMILPPNSYDDVELWVGDIKLDSNYSSDTAPQITATLPEAYIAEYENTILTIKVPQLVAIDGAELGIAVDWLKVEPISH